MIHRSRQAFLLRQIVFNGAVNGEIPSKCGCAHCGNHIEFPAELAGSEIACPHCGETTILAATLPAGSFSPQTLSVEDLNRAFAGPIQRAPVSFFYRAGAALTATASVGMPVIYFVLILAVVLALLCYFWFAFHFTHLTSHRRGFLPFRLGLFGIASLMIHSCAIVSGSLVLFALIKPFFARRKPRVEGMAVTPETQPLLYAFVARICEIVGSPIPSRIEFNCEANAAADLRRNGGKFSSRELVLQIGLPLVAALDLRQFAGVMAHELGHCSQSSGMRLMQTVNDANDRFTRIVCDRDGWDAWLEGERQNTAHPVWGLFVSVAVMIIELVRGILTLFLYSGRGFSNFLLRQMEHDADDCEVKVAGSAAFERTTRQLALLQAAVEMAEKEAQVSWRLGRHLPDDFPAHVLTQETRIPKARLDRIESDLARRKIGLFAAHPADGERLRRAREANEPGVFRLDLPATALIPYFDLLARQVTYFHYVENLGLVLESSNLRPVEAVSIASRR